jgi:hypothetical protein
MQINVISIKSDSRLKNSLVIFLNFALRMYYFLWGHSEEFVEKFQISVQLQKCHQFYRYKSNQILIN